MRTEIFGKGGVASKGGLLYCHALSGGKGSYNTDKEITVTFNPISGGTNPRACLSVSVAVTGSS